MGHKKRKRVEVPVVDVADWRRLHRSGNPSRILADPELRAFVHEHLPTTTFEQIAAASREKFGPERGTSVSAISRYWVYIVRPKLELRPKKSGTRRRVKRNWPRAARSSAAASDT